jgi:hypothetical protein
LYIGIVTLIGIIGFAFRQEMYAIYLVAILTAVGWVVCKDILPTFIAMMIIAMVPLARYGETGYFTNIYYVLIPIGIALIARLFIFRPKNFPLGEFFIPTLAVSIAITLGGLFHLSFRDYFSMPAIYYVAALGFGQLLINFILESNVEKDVDHTIYLSKMMVGVGIMGISMVAITYIKNFQHLFGDIYLFASNFQWGNNLSNNLLIAMPFTFYLACKKKKYSLFYFVLGLLEYAAIVMGLSRGGTLFGTLVLPIAVVSVIICSKENRKKLALASAVFIACVVALVCAFLLPQIKSLVSGLGVSSDEIRVLLYALAWKNFLKYPIFGAGLAYNPNVYYLPQSMCIYWYHSTLFQVLGSLGLVGIIAYLIQSFYRGKALWNVKSRFNLFVLISILGFAGYSMVNVGYFVPLPNMAALLMIFIIVDRNNKYLKKNPKLLEQELVYRKRNARNV